VGLTALFEPFCAVALKLNVLPVCRETLGFGFSVILAGDCETPAGLCPPQAESSDNKNKMALIDCHETEANLLMHPLVARPLHLAGKPIFLGI
jgi:hypothetical protein